MTTLWLIPARGGSKGIPHKNLKPFCGESLVSRAVRLALECAKPDDIVFISTDSEDIKKEGEKFGLDIFFLRDASLATDTASSYSVIIDALFRFGKRGIEFENVVLLQPTSPFRTKEDIENALKKWSPKIDMVVSVKKSPANPYYNLFEETDKGYLKICKGDGHFTRRQDAPVVWEYNGAIYVMTVKSLLNSSMAEFKRIVPYEMPAARSLDIDTPEDWDFAEKCFKELTHFKN